MLRQFCKTVWISSRSFHSSQSNNHTWSVVNILLSADPKAFAKRKYGCLLLNIGSDNFKKYRHLWDEADIRIAVDGSANYLDKSQLLDTAHVVCGDFDSIDQNLLARLRKPKTKVDNQQPQVIETPCQNETDFTKAIRVANTKRRDISFFFALYESDNSRLDQIFGLVNTLHLLRQDIIILNTLSNNISWLLYPGNHTIKKFKGNFLCSLVPFTGPTVVRTQGLEYNVSPQVPMNFGKLISTSNVCSKNCDEITVNNNHDILWSINLSSRNSEASIDSSSDESLNKI